MHKSVPVNLFFSAQGDFSKEFPLPLLGDVTGSSSILRRDHTSLPISVLWQVGALFGDGCRCQKVFEVVVLEADGKSSVKGPVILVADEIVPAGGEVKMFQEPVF